VDYRHRGHEARGGDTSSLSARAGRSTYGVAGPPGPAQTSVPTRAHDRNPLTDSHRCGGSRPGETSAVRRPRKASSPPTPRAFRCSVSAARPARPTSRFRSSNSAVRRGSNPASGPPQHPGGRATHRPADRSPISDRQQQAHDRSVATQDDRSRVRPRVAARARAPSPAADRPLRAGRAALAARARQAARSRLRARDSPSTGPDHGRPAAGASHRAPPADHPRLPRPGTPQAHRQRSGERRARAPSANSWSGFERPGPDDPATAGARRERDRLAPRGSCRNHRTGDSRPQRARHPPSTGRGVPRRPVVGTSETLAADDQQKPVAAVR